MASTSSFGKAYQAARAKLKEEGKDLDSGTFEWGGKKYSTKMAKGPKATPTQKDDLEETEVKARTPAKQRADAYDPLKKYGREEIINWDEISPALTPEKKRTGPSLLPPAKFSTKYDASQFDKIRKGSKPAPGYYGMRKGGSVSSASKRADGIASKGKTKGRFV